MADTLTITGIQTNLEWENKAANLEMFERKIKTVKGKSEIVLLPEMFSTGFSMNPNEHAETMEGESVQWMKRISVENKLILAGSLIIKEGPDFYNRLVWMMPNGSYGYYDKRHLFAYAQEDQHYQAGSKRLIASAQGWKINLLVCYDLRFPVWARQQLQEGIPEYDLLVYVANWPERRINAWNTLLQARAIENQCYVIGINRTGTDGNNIYYSGESMAVNAMGEILYHNKDQEDVFTVTLEKKHLNAVREKLPFWKDADHFVID